MQTTPLLYQLSYLVAFGFYRICKRILNSYEFKLLYCPLQGMEIHLVTIDTLIKIFSFFYIQFKAWKFFTPWST